MTLFSVFIMLKIGGRLKKHNKCNLNMVLIGIFIPLLIFFAIINVTYAYFTAQTAPAEGVTDSGVVLIKVNEIPTTKISEGATTVSRTTLLPGDTLSICGKIENGGTTAVYVLFQMKITIKKSGPGSAETVVDSFFTIVKNASTGKDEQKEIHVTDNGNGTFTYSNTAFKIDAPNADKTNAYTKDFEVSYTLDGDTYNNDYKKATVTYSLNITAIQADSLTPENATQLLMVYYKHATCENASTHTYMTCPICNGTSE